MHGQKWTERLLVLLSLLIRAIDQLNLEQGETLYINSIIKIISIPNNYLISSFTPNCFSP